MRIKKTLNYIKGLFKDYLRRGTKKTKHQEILQAPRGTREDKNSFRISEGWNKGTGGYPIPRALMIMPVNALMNVAGHNATEPDENDVLAQTLPG